MTDWDRGSTDFYLDMGTQLANRYELLEELGAGGMGVVYRARDPWLERDVAVKMIPPSKLDAKAAERFRREARLVARMDHPAIVPIHDFGEYEDSLFFVMPLIEGSTLKSLVADGSLETTELVKIVIEVAEALFHAHERGVIHRDVSPANIMVSTDSLASDKNELRVRVMDFGLARGSQDTQASRAGTLVGTPAYLSPEQVLGQELTGSSDLYSLGAVLYEALTDELMFDGPIASVMYRIVHDPPPSMAARGARVDEELERLVLWCLEKRPQDRPANGRRLADALRHYLRHDEAPGTEAHTGVVRRPALLDSLLPLVGRTREWARIKESLAGALTGECHLLLIGGEAGVGKSRLLAELEHTALEQRVRVLKGRYSDLETSFHYEGLCELVQDYFRNLDPLRSSSRSTGGQLSETDVSLEHLDLSEGLASGLALPDFADLAPDLLALFPVLSEVPELRRAIGGNGDPSEAARPQSGSTASGSTASGPTYVFELFARTLIRLAQGEPLVLLLENLHEADASIEALQYLVHRLAPTPVLIVGTYRSAEAGRGHPLLRWIRGLRDHPRARALLLEPLSSEELWELGEYVLGNGRLSDDLAGRLFEATEGNPLFALELLRSLVDTGGLVQDASGVWTLVGEAALTTRGALPQTLQQAVERRLERLPDAPRSVLAVAAVLGKSFDGRDLEAMHGEGGGDLEDAVDELVEQGLLREDRKARGDRLVFVSGLVRTVLYNDLSRRRRRALHRRFAGHLEERAAGRPERFYPLLVHHFSAGDVPEKTVEYGLAQARWSLAAWNPEDAIRAARIALEFVEDEMIDDARRLHGEILAVLAQAHRVLGQNSQAFEEAAKAVTALSQAGALDAAAAAAWLTTQAAWQGRRIDETRHWVDRTTEIARQASDDPLRRRALLLGSTVANLRGETNLARRYREDAEALDLPTEVTGPVELAEPALGGTLRVALPVSLHSLDPATMETDENVEVVCTIFETLLRLDSEGNFIPALCRDWTVSDDGRRVELTLREGICFSQGAPLTGADVRASFERLARLRTDAPPAALAAITGLDAFAHGQAESIAGIETQPEEPLQLVFHLAEPLPLFPVLLTDAYTAVVRCSLPSAPKEELWGTGPFQLTSLQEGRALLEPNPRFRGEQPRLDKLEFQTGLTSSEIVEGLRRETLDLGRDLQLPDLEELLRDPRFRSGLVETTRKNVHFLLWNKKGPLGRHPVLRRALSGVINTNDLVWRTLGRFAQPAVCLLPPAIPGHDPGRRLRSLAPEDALTLLREARLTHPIRLTAIVHPVLMNRGRDLIHALFQVWAELGVEVDLAELSIDAYLEKYQDNEGIDLLLGRWNADYDDPDTFTHVLFHSLHGVFRRYYASEEADRLLERARLETSALKRQSLYQRFEGLLEQDDALVPLFHDVAYRLAGPRVRKLELASVPPYINYTRVATVDDDETQNHWPLERGELHVPVIAPLSSLDPTGDTFAEHLEVVSTIFEGLTRLDENAGVIPWLAKSFVASSDGLVYHFHLRDDVRFHDGRRLTARDVRYTFERALSRPGTGLHFLLLPIRGARALRDGEAQHISGITIPSAHELVLELEDPVPFFPSLLAHPGAGIVAEGSQNFVGSWRDGCVGTGPFRILRLDPGRNIDLERHPQYWRPGRPRSERLTFHTGREPRQIATDFRDGRYSLVADLRPADTEAFRRDPEVARGCIESPRLSTLFLVLNSQRGPLTDAGLRHSLIRGIDFESLFHEVAGPQAQKAHGLIPPGLVGHEEPRQMPVESPDLSELRGLRLKVAVIPSYIGQYAAVWKELKSRLNRLGISIEQIEAPVSDFVRMTLAGTPDLLCMRWMADFPDPDSFVSGLLHSQDGVLSGMCSHPEIDRLCERGRRELDPALRHALYRELEELLAREAHLAPLLHEQSYRFRHPSISGVKVYFALPEIRYEEIRTRPR